MEFIQWRTGPAQDPHTDNPIWDCYHAIFKLDDEEFANLDEDVQEDIIKDQEEIDHMFKDTIVPDNIEKVDNTGKHLIRISYEVEFVYQWECIKMFADIIGAEPEVYRD